jgi:hypothetical protein
MTTVTQLTEAQPHTIVRQIEDVLDEYRADPRIRAALVDLAFDPDGTMRELEACIDDLVAAEAGQTVAGGVRIAGALADDATFAHLRTAVDAFHARLENAALKRDLTVVEQAWTRLPKGTSSESAATFALRMIVAAMEADPATAGGLGLPPERVAEGKALIAEVRGHHGVTKGGAVAERQGSRSVEAVLDRLARALRIHVSDREVARIEKGLVDADVQLTVLSQWLATRPSAVAARKAAAQPAAGEA